MANRLTHFDDQGQAIMVDVSEKKETERIAVAKGKLKVNLEVFHMIQKGNSKKGDVLGVARVAGIMATKKTSELIPMCHPLMLTKATIDFKLNDETREIEVTCTAKLVGRTGVEMEALTGATVALLTIYDMCKAVDKAMELTQVYLESKTGGKSGAYRREQAI